MEKQEFLESFMDLHELAKEIREYAIKAWSIVGGRPRTFEVTFETLHAGRESRLSVGIFGVRESMPNLCIRYLNEYSWESADGFVSDYPGNLLDARNLLGNQNKPADPNFIIGLGKLFLYLQEECKRGFAEGWTSVDAEARWFDFNKEFVERVNNRRLLKYLEAIVKGIVEASFALRQRSYLHSTTPVFEQIELPARRAYELAERAREATRQGKLFLG